MLTYTNGSETESHALVVGGLTWRVAPGKTVRVEGAAGDQVVLRMGEEPETVEHRGVVVERAGRPAFHFESAAQPARVNRRGQA